MVLLLGLFAALLALLSAVTALGSGRAALLKHLSFILLGLAGVAAAASGALTLFEGVTVAGHLPLGLPWLPWQARVDPLSGLFLLLIGVVVVAVSLYGPGYVREFEHGRRSLAPLGGFTGLFVAGMLLVVLADDAFFFMVAWELMSLASYFLVAYQHENAGNRRAAFLYLLMAHIGGLAILLGYGVLAAFGGGFSFEAMRLAEPSLLWQSVAFGLAFFGFGMKAGLVPLHLWLPEAHPVAPSHISALMSGVMLKVAIYGFVRFTFDLIGTPHWGWGTVILLVGSVSALLGVLYAIMQNDLKRLLAYSSIENVGVIFLALGLATIFLGTGHPVLGQLGLLAALFHAFNHALFKSLLFFGAGAILQHTHERDLDRMGGLLKRMPYTGVFFLIGCLSIASLPPFNGFASEWLTFQTALQGPVLDNGLLRIAMPVAAAVLALTAALGAACFVKVYGVGFLGQPRSRRTRHARKVALGMRIAQGLLALLCLLLGVFPVAVTGAIQQVTQQLVPGAAALEMDWLWLAPATRAEASYSPPLVIFGLLLAWLAVQLAFRLRRRPLRRTAPWDCGFGPLTPRMQYTATAFAMPVRHVFQALLQVDEKIERLSERDRLSGLRYQLSVADRPWPTWYEAFGRAILAASRRVTRLQTGNTRTYLAYSFFTLLFVLWLVS